MCKLKGGVHGGGVLCFSLLISVCFSLYFFFYFCFFPTLFLTFLAPCYHTPCPGSAHSPMPHPALSPAPHPTLAALITRPLAWLWPHRPLRRCPPPSHHPSRPSIAPKSTVLALTAAAATLTPAGHRSPHRLDNTQTKKVGTTSAGQRVSHRG